MRDRRAQQELKFDSKRTTQLQTDQRQEIVAALAALILSVVRQATEQNHETR